MRGRRALAPLLAALLVATLAPPAHAQTPAPFADGDSLQSVAVPGTSLIAIAANEAGVVIARSDTSIRGRVPGVTGVLSVDAGPDGTVWAALPSQRAVVAIDPRTRTVLARYSTPSDLCPGSVAVTGRMIVMGYSCFNYGDTGEGGEGVAVLDTETGQVTRLPGGLQPMVDTSPALPGRAVVVDQGMYATSLRVLDVSTGTPRDLVSRYFQVAKLWDIQLSPDGSKIALADMHESKLRVLRTADLSVVVQREVRAVSPRAVAWLGETRVVVAGYDRDSRYAGAVYDLTQAAPRTTLSWTPGVERFVGQRCLTISPDGRRALVVTTGLWDRDSRLESYGLRSSTTTLTGPPSATVGQPMQLAVQVRLQGGVAPPAGSTVSLQRAIEYSNGPPHQLGSVTLDAEGFATVTDVPQEALRTVWTASYAGTANHAASTASITLPVAKAPADLTVRFERGKTTGRQVSGTLVVELSPLMDQRMVRIDATTSSGSSSYLGEHHLDDTGTLRLAQTVSSPTTFVVDFIGAPRQEDARAQVTVSP